MVMRIVDPADGKLVGEVSTAEAAEVEAAIGAARNAAPGWERTAPAERAAALSRAADRIELDAADLALLTTREMGKPLDDSRGGVAAGVSTLRQYAELGPLHRGKALQGSWSATDLMVPGPVGVVAVITPWNDPVAVSCGLLGAALVTGNTVIYKPSERTPHTGQRLAEYFAGLLPDGVLTLLSGDGEVGALLSRSSGIDLIAHVGSTATGRSIAAAAATTGAKVVLENGGNDPLIVDSDV